MFKDKYHPQVKKDLKKLDRSVRAEIQNTHIQQILNRPCAFDILYGDLSGVCSYHFRKNKVEYRISYMVDESSKTVFVLMIGTRGNFYNILRRRLK
jgi:addiction module RelE/StbE family toxin